MERGGCMGYLSSEWEKKVYFVHYIDLGNTWFTCIWLILRASKKRYKGCPTCGPNTISQYSKCLGKMIYYGHWRWLKPDHPMRTKANDFDGKVEHMSAPNVILGHKMLRYADMVNRWATSGQRDYENPALKIGVKHKSSLWSLPY